MSGGPFAEKEPAQRIIMFLTSVGFIALLVEPALDRRFGWSDLPACLVVAGDLLMLFGWLGIFSSSGKTVLHQRPSSPPRTKGSSRPVPMRGSVIPCMRRHSLMLLGIPLALGSWWGVMIVIAIVPALVWRLTDEERFLSQNLPGYPEYRGRVRYRLLPFVW